VIAIVFAVVMAFLGYEMMQFKRAGKQASGVEVTVSPAVVNLHPGDIVVIQASVIGSENSDIEWTMEEGSAGGRLGPLPTGERDGRVVAAVRYTAPAAPGSFHVVARSKADETRTAIATVVVNPN
jgi:chitinase